MAKNVKGLTKSRRQEWACNTDDKSKAQRKWELEVICSGTRRTLNVPDA